VKNNFVPGAKLLVQAETLGYSLFLLSLIFGIRAVNSIAIALLLLAAIVYRIKIGDINASRKSITMFIAGCLVFYALNLLSLLYTSDTGIVYRHIQLKSSLLFIPLIFLLKPPAKPTVEKMEGLFIVSLFIACILCLLLAGFRYHANGDASTFFYHPLVSPLKHHAVLYSILVVFALAEVFIRLMARKYRFNAIVDILIFLVLFLTLVLLSSKLIIVIFLFFCVVYTIRMVKNRPFRVAFLILVSAAAALLFFTSNPISRRYAEIIKGDLSLIQRPKFNQGTYFNGLQFRLLQWKNVWELLEENKAFVIGVTPGDAQKRLDEKYISKDMYFGLPERNERGLLGYNAHNQFLEALLQLGFVGLAAFLMTTLGLLIIASAARSTQVYFMVTVLILFCLTESVLESQFGLVVYTFFPLFVFFKQDKTFESKAAPATDRNK
jgi:O-antigen ligase